MARWAVCEPLSCTLLPMDELLSIEAWIGTLDFASWDVDVDEEQLRWVAARNSASFHSQLQRVWAAVQMQEQHNPLNEAEHQVMGRIHERGVLKANEWSFVDGLSLLAAHDFEMLARASRVGIFDFWLDKLRAEYEAGRFPHGRL